MRFQEYFHYFISFLMIALDLFHNLFLLFLFHFFLTIRIDSLLMAYFILFYVILDKMSLFILVIMTQFYLGIGMFVIIRFSRGFMSIGCSIRTCIDMILCPRNQGSQSRQSHLFSMKPFQVCYSSRFELFLGICMLMRQEDCMILILECWNYQPKIPHLEQALSSIPQVIEKKLYF